MYEWEILYNSYTSLTKSFFSIVIYFVLYVKINFMFNEKKINTYRLRHRQSCMGTNRRKKPETRAGSLTVYVLATDLNSER